MATKFNQVLDIVGRAERVSFPTLNLSRIPAKIDTGADVSSIWCSKVYVQDNKLKCVFFGPESQYYTGEVITFAHSKYQVTRIANSFGHKELRYKVKIPMSINGRVIKASITLSDRSQKLYPILIGRSTLSGKFLVDVRKGSPLRKQENERMEKLKKEMSKI